MVAMVTLSRTVWLERLPGPKSDRAGVMVPSCADAGSRATPVIINNVGLSVNKEQSGDLGENLGALARNA